jgi:hypothetical protein
MDNTSLDQAITDQIMYNATGDLGVSDYSTPANTTDWGTSGIVSAIDGTSLSTGTPLAFNQGSSSGSGSSTGLINSISSGINSIIGNLTGGQTGVVIDSFGNPVTTANPTTSSIGNLASSLTSLLTSFLPIILIGGVIWLAFDVVSHRRR